MSYYNYSEDEENFSRQLIRYWSNFIKTGFVLKFSIHIFSFLFFNRNPNKDLFPIDKSHVEWKEYTNKQHNYLYFRLNNIHNERNYFDSMYDFWLECFRIENSGHCKNMKIKRYFPSLMFLFIFIFILIIIYFIWNYLQKKKKGHRSPTALLPYPNPNHVSA